jgi:hypothetical protein
MIPDPILRDGFRELIAGWALDDFYRLTDRIERLAEWTKANGPLQGDEERIIKFLIETQIANAP